MQRRPSLQKKPSINQIHVGHEISVVTSYSGAAPRAPSISTSARPSIEHSRSNSVNRQRQGSITSVIGRIREVNSRMTMSPEPTGRASTEPRTSYNRLHPSRSEYVDRDAQSLRELAEFLRNKEPPKENYMSIPDTFESRSDSSRTALGMFRRKSKKPRQPLSIRLPDSAVAAKTAGGHWHIAISIPNEYDLLDGVPNGQKAEDLPKPVQRQRAITNHSSFGAITVLKPVNEDRPLSTASDFGPNRHSQAVIARVFSDEPRVRTAGTDSKALDQRIADLTAVKEIIAEKEAVEKELAVMKGLVAQKEHAAQEELAIREQLALENARALNSTLDKHFTTKQASGMEGHMASLQEIPRPQSGRRSESVPARPPRAYIGVSPDVIDRHYSQRSDQRHSGGTVYSERSLDGDVGFERAFEKGHTRGQSNVSTVPSMSGATISTAQIATNISGFRGIEPPARFSSKSAAPGPSMVNVTSPLSGDAAGGSRKRYSTQAVRRSTDGSVTSETSDLRASIADTASHHRSPSVASGAKSTVSSGPAPTRRLPSIPGRPSSYEDSPTRHSSTRASRQRPLSSVSHSSVPGGKALSDDSISVAESSREKRREHVRALRSRDIAAEKSRHSYIEVSNTAKARSPSSPPVKIKSSRPSMKRRSISASPSSVVADRVRTKTLNSLTRIMLVADTQPDHSTYTIIGGELGVEPFSRLLRMSNSPSRSDSRRTADKTSINSIREAHTPPRSLTPSLASSDEEGQYVYSHADAPSVHTTPRAPITQRERTAAQPRSHFILREDYDHRLALIEKNHALMMSTLSSVLAMGQGLGKLTRVLETQSSRDGPLRVTRDEMEMLESFEHERLNAVESVGRGLGDFEPFMKELANAARVSQEGTPESTPHLEQEAFSGF